MIRSASTQVSRAEHTNRALDPEDSVDGNQQQSSRDGSPFTVYPSSSSGQRQEENRRATINVDNIASQLDAPGDNLQSQLYGHRTPGSGYNLRPSPVKRQYGGEGLVIRKDTSSLPPGKRRKPEGCASPRQHSVHQKTGLSQDQIDVLTKQNKSIRDGSPFTRRPTQPTNTSFEGLPIENAILKCVREDGLATFQLQLTWTASSRTGNAQYQPRAKRGLPFSTLREHSLKAGKGSFKHHAETDASVCQMDSLLVRWISIEMYFKVLWSVMYSP
ncbi:hypothetical protein VFPPC_10901 [Pochonia chlamydosporia 170]|uniref:Uncharacterized protein n=1 Tax=Pochonia chlamydosporia 170 TaxID=1380566 RepID=A0A179EZQ4_METCM|nr:hypothetical protein VFPPC_10901 [Pochonia chlamydosporia 170]OAQ58666.1 hypothetical protein VFPPC_10901 [Pochonia chlamydosporia 170]